MAYERIRVIFEQAWLARISLARPRALNTLCYETVCELQAAFAELGRESALRAVILDSDADTPEEGHKAAPRAFVAGADVKYISGIPQEGSELSRAYIAAGQALMVQIEALSVPVIAAVDGVAFGGGFELALACDIILATRRSSFALPEAKLGLMPGWGGTQRLPRLIGVHNARRLIFTGDTIDAQEALRLGVVQELTDEETLLPQARAMAQRIAACAPLSVSLSKKAINEGLGLPLAPALKIEDRCFAVCISSEDRMEGTRAFVEKRKAVYKGR